MKRLFFLACLGGLVAAPAAEPLSRRVPQPLPGNPGNVFVTGQPIRLPLPPGNGGAWRLRDYDGRVVATGQIAGTSVSPGPLPAGYYELDRGDGQPRASAAVLETLKAPTPLNSPVASDVATAWLVPQEKIPAAANLCALAGLNWVRDRLNWGEVEPTRGNWAGSNRYDFSAAAQVREGLQVLQVIHLSPSWANPNTRRFPLDLRDAHAFYREAARRWRGQVAAFEPWNEADIEMFGGHTGSEMASLQKAAWLGLKAGNPQIVAGLNVFAHHRAATLSDLNDNRAWASFDTYNLHHYEPFQNYPRLYADHRAVSAGRPLWVTECSLPVKWQDDATKEPSDENLRVQSERVPITFALSLFEGAQAVFYFVLPHYVEGQTQFGLLRPDLTPRPGYVALAAVGRFLAGATPLGRLPVSHPDQHGYLFEAKPDGRRAKVLVAWAERDTTLPLPAGIIGVFDHLGRPRPLAGGSVAIGRAPVFVCFKPSAKLALVPPPAPPAKVSAKPSTVVIQALMPEKTIDVEKSAYKIGATETEVPLFLYNFGPREAKGALAADAPPGWNARIDSNARKLVLPPAGRLPLTLRITPGAHHGKEPLEGRVRLTGDFARNGEPVLSMRFLVQPTPSK